MSLFETKIERSRKTCIECDCQLSRFETLKPAESERLGWALQIRCRPCATEILFGKNARDFGQDAGGGKRVIRETKTH